MTKPPAASTWHKGLVIVLALSPRMNKKNCMLSILLVSSGIASSYLILITANFFSRFFQVAYKESLTSALDMMPAPTRFAFGHPWVFILIMLALIVGVIAVARRPESNPLLVATIGLCCQGLVVWAAMFCFCYEGFCGPFTLHHPAEFELAEFVCFEAGVFPITLAALLIPMVAARMLRGVR